MSEVVEALKEARALIANGWTQGCPARDANGTDVNSLDPSAVSFCIYGACYRASQSRSDDVYRLTGSVLQKLCTGAPSVWNDAPERTQSEVLALFDRAIERAA